MRVARTRFFSLENRKKNHRNPNLTKTKVERSLHVWPKKLITMLDENNQIVYFIYRLTLWNVLTLIFERLWRGSFGICSILDRYSLDYWPISTSYLRTHVSSIIMMHFMNVESAATFASISLASSTWRRFWKTFRSFGTNIQNIHKNVLSLFIRYGVIDCYLSDANTTIFKQYFFNFFKAKFRWLCDHSNTCIRDEVGLL